MGVVVAMTRTLGDMREGKGRDVGGLLKVGNNITSGERSISATYC